MHNLTVIVPFFNEVNFLSTSLDRLLKFDIYDQIILIDDGSTDGSHQIALEFLNKNSKFQYFKTEKNLGKGGALNYVKEYVTSSHVVIHDADLEYFPEDLVEMFQVSMNNPNSLILGSRFIGNKLRKNVYLRTVIANKVMSFFFSVINFYFISDVATCYKLLPSKIFKDLNLKESGFSIEIEILSKYLKQNKNIVEVPISYEGRSYKEGKKIKTRDGFKYLLNTIKYRISD